MGVIGHPVPASVQNVDRGNRESFSDGVVREGTEWDEQTADSGIDVSPRANNPGPVRLLPHQ